GVAGGELRRGKAHRRGRNRRDGAGQHRVHADDLGKHFVLSATDELATHLVGQQRLDVEDGCAVHEHRDADRLDGRGKRRAVAGKGVAAAAADECQQTQGDRALHHWITSDTSGPFPTTTFRIVFPVVCVRTDASASARSRSSSSDMPAGTVSRARTLPLICTGTTTSSALATAASNAGQPALDSPSAWPSIAHSSSAVCGAKGDSITTSASIASRRTAIVCRRSTRAAGGSLRVGAPCAVPSLTLYSS